MTAFSLSMRDLLAWPGFDGFVNACLLCAPAGDSIATNRS